MKENNSSNFLNSASNFWSSKFSFKGSQKEQQPKQTNNSLPIQQNTAIFPTQPYNNQPTIYVQNPQFFPNTMINQPISPIPQTGNYYIPSNNISQHSIGRFQNLPQSAPIFQVPQNHVPIYPISNPDPQNPYYQNMYSVPTKPQETGFGAILNKANSFWRPQYPQPQIIPRPHPYNVYSQGFYSDPLSREFSSSNKDSEHISMENNFLNRTYEEKNQIRETPVKKIKKKTYKRKNRSESRKNDAINHVDSVSIAKKMLAIANNWNEVCKKIPANMQQSFKDRMKKYLKKRILPELQLKNRLEKFGANINENNNNNNLNFNEELNFSRENPESSESKLDEIFGQDFEKYWQKNEPPEKNDSTGLVWQQNYKFQNYDLESPTLSKILRPDALSVNFQESLKDKEGVNDFGENLLVMNEEPPFGSNENDLNFVDMIINDNPSKNLSFEE